MSLSRFAVQAPVKVTMIFLGVLLLGYISLTRLPTSLFPDVKAPKVTTTVRTTGLSPEEVERRICEPLERSLFTIRGVVDVTAIARADVAVVVTEFTWETPLDFAFLDVKKAAAQLERERADEIESVTVLRYDPNAVPVVTAAVVGPADRDGEELRNLARNTLKPRFERLEGVANVAIAGGMDREVLIKIDETMLLEFGIEVGDVSRALQQENVNATGGTVEEGARRYLLKATGEFTGIDQIRTVAVTRRGDTPILLRDIATVELVPKRTDSVVLLDGRPGVSLKFFQEAQSNTVRVAADIRKEIEELKGSLPAGTEIVIANDQSLFIRQALDQVKKNAVTGAVLSIAVLLFFLREFRTTLIIALCIPVSIIGTFNLMYFQGMTLNLMSLGGLALGIGSLVDNAIVVVENIFRHRSLRASPEEAARKGASEVSAAIIASTLTTVIVFLPIIYVEGVAAMLFREQALTVAYTQVASLLVALLLIPMLAAKFLRTPPKVLRDEDTELHPQGFYAHVLRLSLRHRWAVTAASLLLLAGAGALATRIPREFFPKAEVRQIGVRIVAPSGTRIESTTDLVQTFLRAADDYRPAVSRTFARIGEDTGIVNADTTDPDGPNTADLFVTLHTDDGPTTAAIAAGLGDMQSTAFVTAMRGVVDRMEGVKVDFKVEQGGIADLLGSAEAPLVIEIAGEEIGVLTRLAAETQARIAQVPGITNVRTNILEGAPEVRIRLDRTQVARLGLDVAGVAATLRQRIDGQVATQIKRETGDVDLRVEVDYGTPSVDSLRGITLRTPTGALVPLASIATFEEARGPREIVRRNQDRIAKVYANLAGIPLSEGIARSQAALSDMRLDRGYMLRFTGEEEQRAEAFGRLGFALLLSVILVYMVMASIFESFLQPFLIMFTIPMAGIGVVAGLLATGASLNVMAMIGIVMLGGIVVNNAIVLLDCVNQVREAHGSADSRTTLVAGCQRRLRPVLMTTGTTLLGVLPLALGFGQGAELQRPLAIAVIGGLCSSTVLTLVLIPTFQDILDSALRRLRRIVRREAPAPRAEGSAAS
jgi:HAE1 family hydrophobic/amphiphilic exporter-1